MNKFETFNKFNSGVLIIGKKEEVLFKNKVFEHLFPDFDTLKKFSHKLNFEACNLHSENIEMYSPIYQAIKSPQNFFSSVSYQASPKSSVMHFNITAVRNSRYVLIIFEDTTPIYKLESMNRKYDNLLEKYNNLEAENKSFIKIKQQAQSQAIKMALINKVSNSIRESIDINQILSSALKELRNMLGAFKIYYAASISSNKQFFKIQEINKEYNEEKGLKIKFDKIAQNEINQNNLSASNCLKDYINSQNLKKSALRIIIPIYHSNNLLGVIVILTHSIHDLSEERDILESISSQLSNAIVQAQLYEKDLKTVAELKAALKELKDTQLQLINSEKMASLGQLIAGVAHEINTPLAAINSNNSIMAKLIEKSENEDIKTMLQGINTVDKEAIARISNMVKSLKKFVRLDEADLQETNINAELDLNLELIRHETKNRIQIIKNYCDSPIIKCYPNILNQVFMNILINACQSIEDKGTITITTQMSAESLFVKIKDTGKGIPSENLDKIFTAGYTTKGVGVGTGLGLAISQKIIQKHNGEITVTSTLNEGTEFCIKLPK